MRLIDADKLYPDSIGRKGLAISQSQIAEAPTVEQSYQMPKDYIKNKLDYSRPHGEWIRHIRSIECSVCKYNFFSDDENENCQDYDPCADFNFNFCPNCGADMRGD